MSDMNNRTCSLFRGVGQIRLNCFCPLPALKLSSSLRVSMQINLVFILMLDTAVPAPSHLNLVSAVV